MPNFYKEMFRALYRFLLGIHGHRSRYETEAAMLLAVFATLNLKSANHLAIRYFGFRFLPTEELWFFGVSLALLCLLHYMTLVRGVEEAEFGRPSGRGLSGIGTLGYVIATAALYLWSFDR